MSRQFFTKKPYLWSIHMMNYGIEYFFRAYIVSYKHEVGFGEFETVNSCKSETHQWMVLRKTSK